MLYRPGCCDHLFSFEYKVRLWHRPYYYYCDNVHIVSKQLPNKISVTCTTISEYYPRLQLTFFGWLIRFCKVLRVKELFPVCGWREQSRVPVINFHRYLCFRACPACRLLSPSVSDSCLWGDRVREFSKLRGIWFFLCCGGSAWKI